jgi:acyl-CoA reductase-like NAD-dependent aldehyde dehydrogenase
MKHYPLYLAGRFQDTAQKIDIVQPYDQSVVATVAQAGKAEIEEAITAAETSFALTRAQEPYQKAEILEHIVKRLRERHEEFAQAICKENGKTIKEARGEVTRAISTFETAVHEAWQIDGQAFDAGITAAAQGRRILVRKFPIGPIAAIAPFNFPLNLSVHKIAPAIAAGCPIVLKPASRTPLSCLLLSEIIHETAWPKGAFSCLPCDREAGQMLVEDDRLKLLSFTGSPSVGWKMKKDAGKKKVVLELGGNAGLLIDKGPHDWDRLIARAIMGAFYQAGQSCISVQRIYCHADAYDEFKKRFVAAAAKLKVGDPSKEDTDIGPLIDAGNRDRILQWIEEAVGKGATLLTGGKSEGNAVSPAVLENVPEDVKLSCEEAFGPVVCLQNVADMDEAVRRVNDSVFGLQCGIFSNDFAFIQRAFNALDVGGVIVGDVPSFRVDHMPYGGIKDSGLGREGVRYAMEDMLEPKAMVYFSAF